MTGKRIRADFNGLFGDLLCLSHGDTAPDETGLPVLLRAGMLVTAFDEDADENGERDELFATGIVEPSPDWLSCTGSRWVLHIDANGVRHQSDLGSVPDRTHAGTRGRSPNPSLQRTTPVRSHGCCR